MVQTGPGLPPTASCQVDPSSDQPVQSLATSHVIPETRPAGVDTNPQRKRKASMSVTASITEPQDDDVQFIFSAPRRRKKKRKRLQSSNNGSHFRKYSRGLVDQPSIDCHTTPLESPRRGSTGMVQRLESCHIGVNRTAVMKTGSLPSIPPIAKPSKTTQLPVFDMPQTTSAPFDSFSSPMHLWGNQIPQIQDHGALQHDWDCSASFEETLGTKRKWDGEPEEPRPHPMQPQYQKNGMSGMQGPGTLYEGISMGNPVPWEMRTAQSSFAPFVISPPHPLRFLHETSHHVGSNQNKLEFTPPIGERRNMHFAGEYRPGTSASRQHPTIAGPSNQDNNENQHGIQIPAALVPDQSVSPRTKTVWIPQPSNSSPRCQEASSQTEASHKSNSIPPPPRPIVTAPLDTTNQGCIMRSPALREFSQTSGTVLQNPASERTRRLHTSSIDVLRKPSLYKIPPWPSPTTALVASQAFLGLDHQQSPRPNEGPSQITADQTTTQGSPVSNTQMMFPQQRAVTPWPMHITSQSSNSTNPIQKQTQGAPRKHSPNLIVDIAETCQENLPFAAIAERHNQPIEKVFDTFSAIIQLPLLRNAADNRRHGSLGKHRLKEFRDAKKAMEKAQEQERKKALKEARQGEGSATGESGQAGKKGKKAAGLLKAAILNNVREKEAIAG